MPANVVPAVVIIWSGTAALPRTHESQQLAPFTLTESKMPEFLKIVTPAVARAFE
jgi:hypothetical protein